MGNRVKGRVKKKSIKAASHSGMGSKRKLSRMGKMRKKDHSGLDATFIGRSSCLKRLQISLKDFRRLCILKGVYPREPRGRTPSNKKGQVFYHMKDLKALAHEPLLQKFRELRAFMKKIHRAAGRNEKEEAARMDALAPKYTLHHLVRERYPRFVDALSDLDDALALIYLFAALPSVGDIPAKVTLKAKSLASSWGAYCATTSSITKCFISVKGVYFEAMIQNCPIRWVVPHSFTQRLPEDVDFKIMLTFFEFYETLIGFVMFKLYNDIGIRYPLPVSSSDESSSSSILTAHLNTLHKLLGTAKGAASAAVTEALTTTGGLEDLKKKKTKNTTDRPTRKLMAAVDEVLSKVRNLNEENDPTDEDEPDDEEEEADISAPLKAALESLAQDHGTIIGTGNQSQSLVLDEEAIKRKRLFSGLTFFFSREIPKGYLELICLSFGGKVGWEGDDSPVSMRDQSITHHIVDRPAIPAAYDSLPKSREYIQPQWIVDCANFSFLLPCSRYFVGVSLPPHLSPWVNDDEEGYKPEYAKEIERLKNGEIADDHRENGADEYMDEHLSEKQADETGMSDSEDEEGETEDPEDDKVEEDRAKAESKSQKAVIQTSHDDDELEHREKVQEKTKKENHDAKLLAKNMMNKKAARLYGRMQHGISAKKEAVEALQRKRKEIETKNHKPLDGKSMAKAKVERLKDERKTLLKEYSETSGSMKKKKTRTG